MKSFITLLTILLGICKLYNGASYAPTWDSLDTRPLPSWYDKGKVGIFIHWGVFSVPGFGGYTNAGEWFWWYWQGEKRADYKEFMSKCYPPSFQYTDFAKDFQPTFFNPDSWADLFSASGAQYVVFTSKHHEGFCNWNTKYSWNWNSVDVGPKMDLVDMLANSIRSRTKLTFGLYHSLYEWFNPLYLMDKQNNYKTQYFVNSKTMPELYELVNRYKPDIIWSDGEWEASDTYWNSTNFLAWLYNNSTVKDTVVTNDRWGSGTGCKHGGFYTCQDRYNPGKLLNHKWENCFTLDKYSWGFRREMVVTDVMKIEEVLYQLVSTVSCGGNVLINIGPTPYGTIPPLFQDRLLQLGQWLNINGEAIYNSKPWTSQNDSISKSVWYTFNNDSSPNCIYAIILDFPDNGLLKLGSINLSKQTSMSTQMTLLGYGNVTFQAQANYTLVSLPTSALVKLKWAWTIKISSTNH